MQPRSLTETAHEQFFHCTKNEVFHKDFFIFCAVFSDQCSNNCLENDQKFYMRLLSVGAVACANFVPSII